jgi:hypothetical protein
MLLLDKLKSIESKVIQRTDEWKKLRYKRIGSSEISELC